MKVNWSNLEKLISSEDPGTVERNKERIRKRKQLRKEREIALKKHTH